MSKENVTNDELGLEEAAVVVATEEKVAKVKKEQTPEEKAVLEAGVAKMREIGVSEKLSLVLDLVAAWGGEKEALVAKKAEVIASFGSSEELKNFIDGDFQTEVMAWQGIAKSLPTLNNIKAFYGRREQTASTKKAKLVQVSIDGSVYNVDSAYMEEVSGLEKEARKAAILSHANTKKVDAIEIF